jgi:hypothetical protein
VSQTTIPVRVAGADYLVTLTSAPNGRVSWRLQTARSRAYGNAPTPQDAIAAARAWLQLRPSVEGTPEEELESALRASGLLAAGGVRRFAKAVRT